MPPTPTISETVICPGCKRKTHGNWPRDLSLRTCIHCGETHDKSSGKFPATKEVAMATKVTKKKTAKKKTSKKKTKVSAKKRNTNVYGDPAAGVFSDTPSGLMQKLIIEGKSNAEVWAVVSKKYDMPDSKKGFVSWMRQHLRNKKGINVPGSDGSKGKTTKKKAAKKKAAKKTSKKKTTTKK
jgi:hypothetical protein